MPRDASFASRSQSLEQAVLEVYQAGPLSVVGFAGRERIHNISLWPLHDEILDLVAAHDCRELAIDLTGVPFVPSGLLGLLASLRSAGIEVLLYNASDDIRDVVASTNLHQSVQMCEVEVAV